MNITYITEYFNTPADGGLMRTWEIAKYLTEQGHHVSVIVGSPHHMTGEIPSRLRRRPIVWDHIAGIDVARVWAFPGFRFGKLGRLLYYLSFPVPALIAAVAGTRPDVVIGSIPPLFSAPAAWLFARMQRTPFVLEFRDGWLEFANARRMIPDRVAKTLFRLQQFLLGQAELVVAVTPGLAELACQYGTAKSRVLLVMNGFEEDVYASANLDESAADELRSALNLPRKFFVVYAGTLGLARDTDIYLRAAERLRTYDEIHFVFIGDGEKRSPMERYCAEHGLINCSFMGLQPRTRIPRLFAGAHVGLNSIGSGQGLESSLSNKLFDYLGSSLPVVFSGYGDTAGFLEKSGGGLVVQPGDDAAFAEAIVALYEHPDLREEMGRKGSEYVRSQFSRRRLLAPFEAALCGLAGPTA